MNMFFHKPFYLSLLIALILNLSAVKLSASELQKEQSLSSANAVTLQLNSGDSPSIWRRDDSGVKLQKLFTVEDLYANLSATATDGDIMWDGSYIEYKSQNWLFGVGKKGRHWSPSRYNSLILSKNARPVPSVYLRYRTDFALDVPLLKYFGPIEAETFNGQLEQARGVPGAMLFGARFKFSPTRDLDLGLFRTAQWGGQNFNSSPNGFLKMLSGENHSDEFDYNQLGGFSASYTPSLSDRSYRFYLQGYGEDESGGLPSCYSKLFGIEKEARLQGRPLIITIEAADTTVDRTEGGFCGPNTAYRNWQYTSGYTHHGRVMGHSIDTESKALSLYVKHEVSGLNIDLAVSKIDLNRDNLPSHRLSSTRKKGTTAEISITKPLDQIVLNTRLAYQDLDLKNGFGTKGLSISFSLSSSF